MRAGPVKAGLVSHRKGMKFYGAFLMRRPLMLKIFSLLALILGHVKDSVITSSDQSPFLSKSAEARHTYRVLHLEAPIQFMAVGYLGCEGRGL
jgi:hypothetical protein